MLEKGATVGAHSLSGAVIEPGPLDALLPEWRTSTLGICVPATRDEFRLLTRTGSIRLPTRSGLRLNEPDRISPGQPALRPASNWGSMARSQVAQTLRFFKLCGLVFYRALDITARRMLLMRVE